MRKEFFQVEDAYVENRYGQDVAGPFSSLVEADMHINKVLKPGIDKEIRRNRIEKVMVSIILFDINTSEMKDRANAEIARLESERDGLHPVWRE